MSFKKKIGLSCGRFSASRHSPHSRLAMLSALARSQVQLRTSPSPRAERSRSAGRNRTVLIIGERQGCCRNRVVSERSRHYPKSSHFSYLFDRPRSEEHTSELQ